MLEHARISERRACRLAGLSCDVWRHPPQPGACTVRLRERIHAVAMQRRRFGYRRVHDMLRSEFPGTTHKKVYRLYREQGLAARKRNKARKYRGERTPLVAATRANQTWSLDFVSDALANGRQIKCLTVTDDFTRECIDISVDLSMPGAHVARVLERAACFRGCPQAIRTDNGPEFTCRAFMAWLQARNRCRFGHAVLARRALAQVGYALGECEHGVRQDELSCAPSLQRHISNNALAVSNLKCNTSIEREFLFQ